MDHRRILPIALLACAIVITRIFAAPAASEVEKPLELTDQPTADHGIVVWAASKSDFPVTVMLDFSKLENLKCNMKLPVTAVIPPHKRMMIARLNRQSALKATQYNEHWTYFMGFRSDKQKPGDFDYALPFQPGFAYRIDQGFDGKFSHQGINALDFGMPEGSTICAARAGVVMEVVESNTEGGVTEEMKKKANRIVILHDDGSNARYAHLSYKGALVHVGQKVNTGDVIGLSGATGYASGPHLHFEIDQPPADMKANAYESVPMHFIAHDKNGADAKLTPAEGELAMRPFPPRDAPLHKFPANAIESLLTSRSIENGKPVDPTDGFRADQDIFVSMKLLIFPSTTLRLKVTRDGAPADEPPPMDFELKFSPGDHGLSVQLHSENNPALHGRCTIHITSDGQDLATTSIQVTN